jgi:hypothetical protein
MKTRYCKRAAAVNEVDHGGNKPYLAKENNKIQELVMSGRLSLCS